MTCMGMKFGSRKRKRFQITMVEGINKCESWSEVVEKSHFNTMTDLTNREYHSIHAQPHVKLPKHKKLSPNPILLLQPNKEITFILNHGISPLKNWWEVILAKVSLIVAQQKKLFILRRIWENLSSTSWPCLSTTWSTSALRREFEKNKKTIIMAYDFYLLLPYTKFVKK